jgi:hypothetical protein
MSVSLLLNSVVNYLDISRRIGVMDEYSLQTFAKGGHLRGHFGSFALTDLITNEAPSFPGHPTKMFRPREDLTWPANVAPI